MSLVNLYLLNYDQKIINKFNLTLLITERYQNDRNILIELRLKDYYLEIKRFQSKDTIVFDVDACDGSTDILYNQIFKNSKIHLIQLNSLYLKKLRANSETFSHGNNNKFFTYQLALRNKNQVK